jgi:putative spermidine/putrescine transport system ATP-binding protein
VRPQNVSLSDASGALRGRVKESMITGSLTKLYVSAAANGDEPVVLSYPTSSASSPRDLDSEVAFEWRPSDAVALPESA